MAKDQWFLSIAGICVNQAVQQACNIEDVTVECGYSRRKRNTGQSNQLKIKFKVKMPPLSKLETNCRTQCESTARVVLFDDCYSACEADVEKARRNVLEDVKVILSSGRSTTGSNTGTGSNINIGRMSRPSYVERNVHASGKVCLTNGTFFYGNPVKSPLNSICIPCL